MRRSRFSWIPNSTSSCANSWFWEESWHSTGASLSSTAPDLWCWRVRWDCLAPAGLVLSGSPFAAYSRVAYKCSRDFAEKSISTNWLSRTCSSRRRSRRRNRRDKHRYRTMFRRSLCPSISTTSSVEPHAAVDILLIPSGSLASLSSTALVVAAYLPRTKLS